MKKKNNIDLCYDKMIKILSKSKIDYTLCEVFMLNFKQLKSIKTKNNLIDLSHISSKINYINSNIEKYHNIIEQYKSENKKTFFLHDELDKLYCEQKKLLLEIINIIDKNISTNFKELIFLYKNNNDIHYIIENHKIHNLYSAAIFDDNNKIKEYYIDGKKIEESEWIKHPLVRSKRINKLMK